MEELKDFLISLVKILIPCAVIALIIFMIVKLQPEEELEKEIDVRGYDSEETEYVLENDKIRLVMDALTTQFKVELKGTDTVWYSNPQNVSDDPIALAIEKSNMSSTMFITYGTINGVWTTLNNYDLSIKNGLYEIEQKDDSLRVNYTIGNVKKEYLIPIAVPESRFNELIDLLDKKSAKQVKEYYRKYDIKKLRKTDNKEELLKKYPDLEKECIYVLIDSVADYLKKKIETIFEGAGYTYDDYITDLERYNVVTEQDIPIFNVSVEYKLEDDDLVVSVPLNEIEYKSKYPIVSLDVLPYMGAGSTGDTGYILVPESGGGIINFNNGRQDQNAYVSNIYGWDYAQSRDAVVYETKNAFPLFGICNNNASFLCMIEDGASFGTIKSDVSGRRHSYNYCYYDYSVLHYEAYDVSEKSNKEFYVFEAKLPDTTVKQRYRFAQTDNYTELALIYRDYLTDRYPELAKKTGSETPVVVEVLEAIDKVQQIYGIPKKAAYKLTSYSETADIVKDFYNRGITDFDLKILGWMNGGVKHSILNGIKLESVLGGKKDFSKMLDSIKALGIDICLDAEFDFAYDSDIFDGFVSFKDAARLASREQVELRDYSTIWYGQDPDDELYYLNKPQLYESQFNELNAYAKDHGVGVSLRYTGSILSADYNPKNLFTREMILSNQQKMIQEASSGKTVMINYGNDYALEYADIVTNMDITNSNNAIIDFDIPFYQIALHGLIDYTGSAINLAEDYEKELLKSAEYGAGISFLFTNSDPSMLQATLYTDYYAADYHLWADKAEEICKRYTESFNGLNDKKIVSHRLSGDNVRITEYEDGTKVFVNFGYLNETAEGITIPARDYLVVRR